MADSYSQHSPDVPLREAPQRTDNYGGATRGDMWRPVTDMKDLFGTVSGGAGFVAGGVAGLPFEVVGFATGQGEQGKTMKSVADATGNATETVVRGALNIVLLPAELCQTARAANLHQQQRKAREGKDPGYVFGDITRGLIDIGGGSGISSWWKGLCRA